MTEPDRAEVVLSAEQLSAGTEWTISGGLRIRKRIVTETRTVEVTLQREELVVEPHDVVATNPDGRTWAGTSEDGPPTSPPVARVPLVIVLQEELPDVRTITRPYEQITVRSVLVDGEQTVHGSARHEEALVESAPPSPV